MRNPLDYFVLDSLANDIEAIENILKILNSDTEFGWRDQHPQPFERGEIIPSLLGGVQRGDIEACVWSEEDRALVVAGPGVVPGGYLDDVWFRLTDRGRTVLESWDPPPSPVG